MYGGGWEGGEANEIKPNEKNFQAQCTLGVRAKKILGPTLSIFRLQIGPKLLINARTLAPRVANWPPKFDGIPRPPPKLTFI